MAEQVRAVYPKEEKVLLDFRGWRGLAPNERREQLREVRVLYRSADRRSKSEILSTLCRELAVHRKHAIRMLREPGVIAEAPSSRIPSRAVIAQLAEIRELSGSPGSRRLRSALPWWCSGLQSADLAAGEQERLATLSPATIDRYLRLAEKQESGRDISGLYQSILSEQNPLVETLRDQVLGAIFVRSVALVGQGGEERSGILFIDSSSGWIVVVEREKSLEMQLASIEKQLPFPILCMHVIGDLELVEVCRERCWTGASPIPFSSGGMGNERKRLDALCAGNDFQLCFNYGHPIHPLKEGYGSPFVLIQQLSQSEQTLIDRRSELLGTGRRLRQQLRSGAIR